MRRFGAARTLRRAEKQFMPWFSPDARGPATCSQQGLPGRGLYEMAVSQ